MSSTLTFENVCRLDAADSQNVRPTGIHFVGRRGHEGIPCWYARQHTATYCDTLQHTATHGGDDAMKESLAVTQCTQQHTADDAEFRTALLVHTATRCNIKQHTVEEMAM